MNLRPFPFATIGYRPFAETGEFVTVGVLVYDPADRRMAVRLEDVRRTGRVTGLFPDLELGIYRAAMHAAKEELEAVARSLDGGYPTPVLAPFRDANANIFEVVTSPREGMIFHPVKGRRLAANLDEAIESIFLRYVHRQDLAPHVRAEDVMEQAIHGLFERLHLENAYRRNVTVGNDNYRTKFTFGHFPREAHVPDRVVRPINFDRKDCTDIYRYGDEWIGRVKRLQQFGMLPEVCVLTVRQPGAERPELLTAVDQVLEELAAHRAVCVNEGDDVALANLVRLDTTPDLALIG
jgi:hypothetical protein